jgi:hypothetical protein
MATVHVDGYGPVEVRALTRSQWRDTLEAAGGDIERQLAEVTCLGCPLVAQLSDEALIAEFGDRPQALADIAGAIVKLTREANPDRGVRRRRLRGNRVGRVG